MLSTIGQEQKGPPSRTRVLSSSLVIHPAHSNSTFCMYCKILYQAGASVSTLDGMSRVHIFLTIVCACWVTLSYNPRIEAFVNHCAKHRLFQSQLKPFQPTATGEAEHLGATRLREMHAITRNSVKSANLNSFHLPITCIFLPYCGPLHIAHHQALSLSRSIESH